MLLRNSGAAALAVALAVTALHAQTSVADLPPGDGPRATSQGAPGQDAAAHERYDEVGYAGVELVGAPGTVLAGHARLPVGSFVEVTALDSGKTAVVMVGSATVAGSGELIALSPAAAKQIGVAGEGRYAVRVRLIEPNGPDQTALRGGRAGSDRLDAPPMLLTALRKKLPVVTDARPPAPPTPQPKPQLPPKPPAPAKETLNTPVVKPLRTQPVPPAPTAPKKTVAAAPLALTKHAPVPAKGGLYLQVAALSSEARAKALAATLGGVVVPGGKLYRVRTGPYADMNAARNARDALARRGYAGANIVSDH